MRAIFVESLEEDLSRLLESASVTELAPRMLLTDDQKETAVEGNEVAHGEDNEEPLPPTKKARAL